MSVDREKSFANAERLLRQGRVPQALEEYKRLADESPRDLLMLNRIGDVLARAGRSADAIGYYEKVADQFAGTGFYSKAGAILKKVIKLDTTRTEALIRLGELSVHQKHHGEARQYFLTAADAFLRSRQFGRARQVYEKLVAAEPNEPMHRVRLAEARAAEGDGGRAGNDMLAVAGSLEQTGRTSDAETIYRRAMELLPDRIEPVVGLAALLGRHGREDEALGALEALAERRPGDGALLAECLVLSEQLGRRDRSIRILVSNAVDAIPDEAFERAVSAAHARGDVETLWERIDAVLARWCEGAGEDRAAELLERLARVDERGFIPALESLCAVRRGQGALAPLARAMERLVLAFETHGEAGRAAALRDELRQLSPESGDDLARARVEKADLPREPERAPHPGVDAFVPSDLPMHLQAPAVPLDPADEDLVSGHLTEAEVFQKYGLINEALQQLREVTRRFPGHVVALERLVTLLRGRPHREELRDTLVTLAVARRACGDHARAREEAEEAARVAPLDDTSRRILSSLRLLEVAPTPPSPRLWSAPPAPPEIPSVSEFEIPAPASWGAGSPGSDELGEGELEITFEEDVAAVARPASPTPPPGRDTAHGSTGPRRRALSPDMIEEVEAAIAQGRHDEAERKLAALRTLGFSGPELDGLEARARARVRPPIEAGPPIFEEDELTSITAALEAEFGAPEGDEPAPPVEQSLEEVLGEFKRQIEDEVGRDDFRTHYDLGIAYKEMGLTDDALAAFHQAARSPTLFREACSMIALCHRERGEPSEAIRWYREALEAPGAEDAPLAGVRYDLAEVLAEAGDHAGALALFREVMSADPAYRDVRRHVADLQSRVGG